MDENQYPVLVYGTLRPTGGNYEWLLQGETVAEQTVRLDGFTMYGTSGCPFLGQGGGEVTFELITIDPTRYDEVMYGMDGLEGFRGTNDPHNSYERILHTFMLDGVEVSAWIYVASTRLLKRIRETTPVIPSGDWLTHEQNYLAEKQRLLREASEAVSNGKRPVFMW